MKHFTSILSGIFIVLTCSFGAYAEEAQTHNLYKVTTYNLGALLGEQGAAGYSMQNYEPLLITSTKADILNEQQIASDQIDSAGLASAAQGFAISAEYSATPQLAVQGVFGITQIGKEPSAFNSPSSWEANLGVIYRFLDNLSYQIHFGYMETGDLFSERNSYSDAESIIMISNKLTMSF